MYALLVASSCMMHVVSSVTMPLIVSVCTFCCRRFQHIVNGLFYAKYPFDKTNVPSNFHKTILKFNIYI
jgi:hypothetical protein